MTDKERYEFAMKENHELREELKAYREANHVLNTHLVKLAVFIELTKDRIKELEAMVPKCVSLDSSQPE